MLNEPDVESDAIHVENASDPPSPQVPSISISTDEKLAIERVSYIRSISYVKYICIRLITAEGIGIL